MQTRNEIQREEGEDENRPLPQASWDSGELATITSFLLGTPALSARCDTP